MSSSVPITKKPFVAPLVLITSLFFLWAIGVNLNDIVIQHLKKAFGLSDFRSSLIRTAFFRWLSSGCAAGWLAYAEARLQLGSSSLVRSIIGGAVCPAIMGGISDASNIQTAFVGPLICHADVLYFSLQGYRAEGANNSAAVLDVASSEAA